MTTAAARVGAPHTPLGQLCRKHLHACLTVHFWSSYNYLSVNLQTHVPALMYSVILFLG